MPSNRARKAFPSFPAYPADWLSSPRIAAMSPAQEGAYWRLLCYEWQADDCGLPDDDTLLAGMSRLGPAWANGDGAIVRACFDARNGRLYNARLLAIRAEAEAFSKAMSEAGRKGAEARLKPGSSQASTRSSSANCCLLSADCSLPSAPAVGEGSPTTPLPAGKRKAASPLGYSPAFLTFWTNYPRKIAKGDAWKAWRSSKLDPSLPDILAALSWQRTSDDWQKDNGAFIPYPASYLRARRWEDEQPPADKIPDWKLCHSCRKRTAECMASRKSPPPQGALDGARVVCQECREQQDGPA